jgi:hypothetical protein
MPSKPTVLGFLTAFFKNVGALMSGAVSVPFTYLGLQAPDSQKTLFFVLASVCVLMSAYFVWARERRSLVDMQNRLEEIALERPFHYEDFTAFIQQSHTHGSATIALVFKNEGARMLRWEIKSASCQINNYSTAADLENDEVSHHGYIHSNQSMTYSLPTIYPFSTSTFPVYAEIAFHAEYDNVPSIKIRTTKRKLSYTIMSFNPVVSTNSIVEQIET